MRSPLAAALLVSCVLAIALGAPAATARPPPTAICGVCGDPLDDSPVSGIDGATGAGTLDVYVDENGDSRWVARIPVDAESADRYREDPDALEAAVADSWIHYHAADGDVTDVETDLEDGDVVVEYAVPDVASPGVGDAWVVDYFYVGESFTWYGLAADRVTIHPPEGHTVTNRPSGAAIEDGAATWTRDGNTYSSDVDGQSLLTYADDDGIVDAGASHATVATITGPLVAAHAGPASAIPVAIVAVGAFVVGRVDRGPLERTARSDPDEAPPAFAALDAVRGRIDRPLGRRELIALAVGAAVLAGLGWRVVVGTSAVLPAAFVLAAGLFLPMGYALERGEARRGLAAAATLAPVAAVAALAPYHVGFGFGPFVAGLLFLPWALGAVTVGYLLSLVGRRLAVGR